MDNNTAGSRKLFLKPAKSGLQKTDQPLQQNGSSSSENGSLFSLNNNPFLKCDKEESETAVASIDKDTSPVEKSSKEAILAKDLFRPPSTNLFKNATTLSENSNFVFGQNLHARVVTDKAPASTESENKSNEEKEEVKPSELLFSSALSQQSTDESLERTDADSLTQSLPTKTEDQSSDENLSLIEAARRYEETKSAQKRKYEEVEVITGEENDKNIIDMNCRLFTFDKNNWEERGRGTLRLNDCKNSARVVFRASGSLRLMLNTKVWRDQVCEQANSKSLRLTAIDASGLVKIYLVTGRIEDIDNLYQALSLRIRREKDRTPEPENDKNETEAEAKERTECEEEKSSDDEDESSEPVSKKIATETE